MPSLPTGTVTFLFTDIEGSTRLLQQLGDRYAGVLDDYRHLLRVNVRESGGREVDSEGDAFFSVFPRARDAVTAAVAAQRALAAYPWPENLSVCARMGLHTGEALPTETGYVGMDVHRAARICAAGHGGQILLSQSTYDLVADEPPERVHFRDLGEHRLKDLTRPQHLFQLVAPDMRADFPPLRSLDVRPNNLPVQLTSFIGREREIAEVKTLLGSTRLLTLTGAGGCGKTRLALQVAGDALELFRGGVWFVDLVRLAEPTIVPQAVASALDVREAPGRPLMATLAEYLRGRHVLLVLDNCEHLVIACAQLADALLRNCPDLRILATSREAIGVEGELTFRIPSLSLPNRERLPPFEQLIDHEAVRLFSERARWSQPAFAVTSQNAGAIAQVCIQLDGIPLAIEMAAARVKVLTVEQIATRLDDRFRFLNAGSRTALPRHQTLRAAMDWSYDLLPPKERGVLRRAAVFAGGWTLEAAERICIADDAGASEILNLLSRLVDKSLVIAEPLGGEGRYRLLETVRQYGLELLEESREMPDVRRRHRDWFLEFAESAEPRLRTADQDRWMSSLELEHDNLRGALAWSLAQIKDRRGETADVADLALRLVGALWWFWLIGGHFSEGQRWLEQVLAASEGASSRVRAWASLGRGVLTFMLGDFKGATALFEESLRLSKEGDDPFGTARAIGWLAVPATYASDHERAVAYWRQSLTLWRKLADPWGIAWTAQGLGFALGAQGETQSAVPLLKEALVLCRRVGDKWLTALTLHNSANLAIARGDVMGATPLVDESLSLFRELRDRRSIARALGNLALIARAQGDYDRAIGSLRESLTLFREVGDKRGIALCFERLGNVACARGRSEQAARLFGAADTLREAIGVTQAGSGRAAYEFGGAGDRAAVRAEMGDGAFELALAQGRAMTLEQAIECALAGAT